MFLGWDKPKVAEDMSCQRIEMGAAGFAYSHTDLEMWRWQRGPYRRQFTR
jgi:hypothetical protein